MILGRRMKPLLGHSTDECHTEPPLHGWIRGNTKQDLCVFGNMLGEVLHEQLDLVEGQALIPTNMDQHTGSFRQKMPLVQKRAIECVFNRLLGTVLAMPYPGAKETA